MGGWSTSLPPALAMCDLCLRSLERGGSNVCTPLARFERDRPLPPLPPVGRHDWPWRDFRDPFWNPNLDPRSRDGSPFRCGHHPPRVRPVRGPAPLLAATGVE
jgi:hypothetical protein